MAEFRIPNKIIYGNGSVQQLSSIKGDRLMLIYDDTMIISFIHDIISASGITMRIIEASPDYIDIHHVMNGTKAMMEFKPEWVLAVGGHGAMDLAKAIRIFYQRPDITPESALLGSAAEIPLNKTKLIALPLYNTNGGEASCSAFIADTNAGCESEICNAELMPDITIIDPDMLSRSNQSGESCCVLSTFVLAIDAAANIHSSNFVRPLALEAIRILSNNIPAHSAAPSAVAPLLYAQCLAGIAYANSAPCLCGSLCRAMAHAFGTASLGSLGAILLPSVIHQDKAKDKYIPIANAMGLSNADSLSDAIREYADMFGLPLTLSELGASKNTFLKKLNKISHRVIQQLPQTEFDEKEPQKYIEQILRMSFSSKEL